MIARWPHLAAAWFAASVAVAPSCLAATVNGWASAAADDVKAMHDIIRDNHPGPVNAQDPAFKDWLERGETEFLVAARTVNDEHDYRTVLLSYANGFADGHLAVRFLAPDVEMWPGFLTRTDTPNGQTRVVLTEDAPGVAEGDVLVGCGGVPAHDLLQARVLRPRTNPLLPQRLLLTSPWLTIVSADDTAGQAASCTVRNSHGEHAVPIRWRPLPQPALSEHLQAASGIIVPPLGLHRAGDVWFISIPSFTWDGADAARMLAVVAAVRAHAAELHAARHVVFDLRGNTGGNSEWGEDLATALWGRRAVQAVEDSFDGSVDWRVSATNSATIRADAANMRAAGHPDDAAVWDRLAHDMDAAQHQGRTLLPQNDPAVKRLPLIQTPFAHPVLVLTEQHCFSACLDFLDLLERLPGTVRIGLPTSADTNYLDVAVARLPSGHATLAYAMKVYRHRARPANSAYQPAFPWPGGVMNDASLVTWIDTLH